ncbi:MAG TPA: AI-2E family transporter [Saliniramus sp.]|nr:AI-2E family transporter [Saliniramus sp.]
MAVSPRKARLALPGENASILTFLAAMLLAVMVVWILYVGRDFFIPIALAILLSFVLAPVVRLLQALRIPKAIAVVFVVVLAFGTLFVLATILAQQVTQLAGDLPRYQVNMRDKVQDLRGVTAGGGTLERAADILQDLGTELNDPEPAARAPIPDESAGAGEPSPIPVELREPERGPLETLTSLISPLVSPLATTGIIIIFVFFILFQREDLRNRLIWLAGANDLQRTTAALDDAARRVSRLLTMQVLLNAGVGAVTALGLWLIGVPSAILWGMLSAVLHFIPYVGPVISAVFPLTVAAAVDPGWSLLLWTAMFLLVLELLAGQVIEPMLYGRSTGLSPVAVVVSATFWTWLWGPIGLVLAMPLSVCLVVIGRHVEGLRFIEVMFGDRPALSAPEMFYQRMLAGDPSEAIEQAELFLEERSLSTYYETVAIEGLSLAQEDLARGKLETELAVRIHDAVCELVEELSHHEDVEPAPTDKDLGPEALSAVEASAEQPPADLAVLSADDLAPEWGASRPVLCIGVRSALDGAAANIFAQLLEKHGIGAGTIAPELATASGLSSIDRTGIAMVCLCAMDAKSPTHVRLAVRRIRRLLPEAKVMVGLWSAEKENGETISSTARADHVAITLRAGLSIVIESASTVEVIGETVAAPLSAASPA